MKDSSRSAEKWDSYLKLAPCGYLLTDAKGRILVVNSILREWLQYSEAELLGIKKLQDLLPVGGKLFYETQHITLVKIQRAVYEINYELIKKDQVRFPVLVSSRIHELDNKDEFVIQHIILPYSDRKKYEEEIVKAKKKAEIAIETKNNFLSTITHEIRTPIHTIIGMSDLLDKEVLRSDQKEMLQMLNMAALNLLELVNNVLDLNKIEVGKFTLEERLFDLKKLLRDLLDIFRPLVLNKPIDLMADFPEDTTLYLIADDVKIRQVLTNLISNAIKFTREGFVKVNLRLGAIQQGRQSIHFSVEDTGIGMSKEELKHTFEPFTQANTNIHREYGGSGLGLSIAQKILHAYGSKLKVASVPGKGSEFTFELNLLKPVLEKEPTVSKKQTFDKPVPIDDQHVLIVDDSYSNQYIVVKHLERWGVRYQIAKSGAEAIKLVKANEFDLVLMDIQLPDMDGYQVCQSIRALKEERYQNIPIIAFSAMITGELSSRMKAVGMDGALSKPFRPATLRKLIQDTLKLNSSKPESERMEYSKEIKASRSERATPNLELVIEFFEGEKGEIQQYLANVTQDVEILLKKFEQLQSKSIIDEKAFHAVQHDARSLIHMFQFDRLKDLINHAFSYIAQERALATKAIINDILKELEEFHLWLKTQYRIRK